MEIKISVRLVLTVGWRDLGYLPTVIAYVCKFNEPEGGLRVVTSRISSRGRPKTGPGAGPSRAGCLTGARRLR